MTAIISAYTKEGFVIGADGRSLGPDKTVFSDCSQKIFHFKHRHISVVYAWCGTTCIMNEAGKRTFDLNPITRNALRAASLS